MPTPCAKQVIEFLKQLVTITTPKQLKHIIDKAKGKEIYGICECILNTLLLAVNIPSWLLEKLKKFKTKLRLLGQGKRKVTIERRRLLLRVPSSVDWLPDLLSFVIPILEGTQQQHVELQTTEAVA
jgi:hypothetical protein